MNAQTIGINPFVNRQLNIKEDSDFGGFTGNDQAMKGIALDAIANRPLSKPVEIVRFYPTVEGGFGNLAGKFLCTHAIVSDKEFVHQMIEVRRPGEQPVVVKWVKRESRPAALTVDLILYSHDALMAENAASGDWSYELISVNCICDHLEAGVQEPMAPATMWRNYLASIPNCPAGVGGTFRKEWEDFELFKAQLAEAEKYWANKARVFVHPAHPQYIVD